MIRFHTEQTIARSALDVWTYAADILRHPEWMEITDARVVHGQGTQAGAQGRERVSFGPFHWDVEFEVAEADPGRRIVWRGRGGAPLYRAALQLHGLWRSLTPFVAIEGKAAVAGELRRLKEQVEGVLATAPAT